MMFSARPILRALVASALTLATFAAPAAPFSPGAPPACADPLAPSLLAADGKLSPSLGTSTAPLFSWAVPSTQEAVDAVHVQVFSTLSSPGTLLWDSGEVPASPGGGAWSLQYGGASALAAGAPFAWRAATRYAGAWSAWSANATGATSLEGSWSAGVGPVWAAAAAAPGASQFVLLRSELVLPAGARVEAALAFATAQPQRSLRDHENGKLLGAYKLWVGGALAGVGPGRPGRCGPQLPAGADCAPEHVFDTLDVTALAATGASASGGRLALALAAFAAPGPDAPRVLLEVVVYLAGGGVVRAGTRADGVGGWSALDASEYMGASCCAEEAWFFQPQENFDARREPVGWRQAGFAPGPGWAPVVAAPPFVAPLVRRRSLALALTEGLAPATASALPDGSTVYAFAKEFQGGVVLDFPADSVAGSQWVVAMGEELRDDGSVLADMRTGNNYTSIITARAGAARVEQHEYSEFRYVQVSRAGTPPAAATCAASAPGDYATPLTLSCGGGGRNISAFTFVSYGAPSGACAPGGGNSFAANATCDAPGAAAVLRGLCLGRATCTFTPSDALFAGCADPCHRVDKRLAAAWTCAGPPPPPPPPPAPAPAVSAWAVWYPASFVGDAAAHCPGGAAGTGAAGGSAATTAFASSSPELDEIFAFCEYTVRAANLDIMTDSNTRQRSPVCAEAALATNAGVAAAAFEAASQEFLNAYMINMSPAPAGAGWAEWQALLICGVREAWLASGDLQPVRAAMPRLTQYLERELFSLDTGLWTADAAGSWSSDKPEVDWPVGMRDGFVFVPANTVVNAHYVGALDAYADLAEATGDVAAAAAARANATALAAAMRARLWDAGASAFVDGAGAKHSAIHSTAFAVARGVADGDADMGAAAWRTLVARLDAEGGVPVGPYPGLFYGNALFRNSSDHGRVAVGQFLLANGTNSWRAMLRAGATMTMEAWAVQEKANLTWSHPWMAFALSLIARWLLGVRALTAGFTSLTIQPQLGPLAHAAGAVATPRGAVTVAVVQALGADGLPTAFNLSTTVPGATTAYVCLPLGACGAGAAVRVDGHVAAGAVDGDWACVTVQAGVHAFSCPA